jgi:hypothetical protein
LNWEVAHSSAYQILVSTNGSSWTEAYSTSYSDGGTDDLAVSRSARYVRMNGTLRATPYGHSLWEFEIYGACGSSTPSNPPTDSPSDPPAGGTWQAGVAYGIGAQVSYGGRNYRCQQAHTSQLGWEPPNAASLWVAL